MADSPSPTGVEASGAVSVVVADEQSDVPLDVNRWSTLATDALRAVGRTGELTLTFVDRAEIASLNEEHMGVAGPTDVLSFPLDDDADSVTAGPILLGDVVICPSVAADAAGDHAGTLDDELALLTVHGVLHIAGFDHADAEERVEMQAYERAILCEHHWHGPVPAGFRHDQVAP